MIELTREQAVELACGVQGWMNREELAFLYDRASEVPPGGTWVEIGTWKGRSAMATGLGLSEGSTLICVDNYQGNPESTAHWEAGLPGWLRTCTDMVASAVMQMRPEVVVQIVEDSSENAANYARCADGLVDAVFIDASHTHDALCSDIRAWLPRLKPGGLLCGHDLCNDWPEVETAVLECLGEVNLALRGIVRDQCADKPVREYQAGTIWFWRKPT